MEEEACFVLREFSEQGDLTQVTLPKANKYLQPFIRTVSPEPRGGVIWLNTVGHSNLEVARILLLRKLNYILNDISKLRVSDVYGSSDCLGDEVPGILQLCS